LSKKSPQHAKVYKLFMQCYHCRKIPDDPNTMKICVCQKGVFCNADCQKKDWFSTKPVHRPFCKVAKNPKTGLHEIDID
jgi:hypothetical protein